MWCLQPLWLEFISIGRSWNFWANVSCTAAQTCAYLLLEMDSKIHPLVIFLATSQTNWTGLMKLSLESVCGGPKNYDSLLTTYKRAGVTTTFERINSIKCKGVVDTVASNWKVNFDELRDLILESYKEMSCEENPPNETITLNSLLTFQTLSLNQFINRGTQKDSVLDKTLSLTSQVREKQYRVFFDKRVIDNKSFKTFPFGYSSDSSCSICLCSGNLDDG